MRPITSWFLVRPVSGRAGLADPGRTTPPPLPSPPFPFPPALSRAGRDQWAVGVASVPRAARRVSLYSQLRAEDAAGDGEEFMEGTDTHTHRRPLVCLTHTPSSSGGRCHLLTSIIGQCLIDDSKDFNGQNREDRSRKHFSTSCLCTWTFCISRLTGPGRSRFAGKTLCTRHLLPQVRPYGKTTELKFQQI